MDRNYIASELLMAAKDISSGERIAKEINAASEITLEQLIEADPWVETLLRSLAQVSPTFRKVDAVFSGIHGNIIHFSNNDRDSFSRKDLANLSRLDGVRWFKLGKNSSIGIEGTWID